MIYLEAAFSPGGTMSGATEAVIMVNASAGGSAGASAFMSAMAATGGVVVAGAAIYLVARQMKSDYYVAVAQWEEREKSEANERDEARVHFAASMRAGQLMAMELSPTSAADPNTAFMLGALSRLRSRLNSTDGDGNGPHSPQSAALRAKCEAVLQMVAVAGASAQLSEFEHLSAQSAAFLAARQGELRGTNADIAALVREEVAALEADVRASPLARGGRSAALKAILERAASVQELAAREPKMALQALQLLQERARGEIKRAAKDDATRLQNAGRARELAASISANARAVLNQTLLETPRKEAGEMLKRLSALVSATPVELSALELLAAQSTALFEQTQTALDERAMQSFLEDQVQQVLSGMGYRVSSAANSRELVAVLDAGTGVQLHIDGKGALEGKMVALSSGAREISSHEQEKVCNLMDAIFDGLRRRNLVVREKKRRNFKAGQETLQVVQLESETQGDVSSEVARRALATPQARHMGE